MTGVIIERKVYLMSYKSQIKTVEGNTKKKLMLFTLSTCIWCRKTKALLSELGVGYQFVDVDLLNQTDQDEAYDEMGKYQSNSFPTVIFNDGEKVIVGYEEEKIKDICV